MDLNPLLKKKITPYCYGIGAEDATIHIPTPENPYTGSISTVPFLNHQPKGNTTKIQIKNVIPILEEIYKKHPNELKILKRRMTPAELKAANQLFSGWQPGQCEQDLALEHN